MEAERGEIIDQHATELEEARKFFSDLAEKTMSEARTMNHFYHKKKNRMNRWCIKLSFNTLIAICTSLVLV